VPVRLTSTRSTLGRNDEVLRQRAWPFAVRRIEGDRNVFGTESLLHRTTRHIATNELDARLVLDASAT